MLQFRATNIILYKRVHISYAFTHAHNQQFSSNHYGLHGDMKLCGSGQQSENGKQSNTAAHVHTMHMRSHWHKSQILNANDVFNFQLPSPSFRVCVCVEIAENNDNFGSTLRSTANHRHRKYIQYIPDEQWWNDYWYFQSPILHQAIFAKHQTSMESIIKRNIYIENDAIRKMHPNEWFTSVEYVVWGLRVWSSLVYSDENGDEKPISHYVQ